MTKAKERRAEKKGFGKSSNEGSGKKKWVDDRVTRKPKRLRDGEESDKEELRSLALTDLGRSGLDKSDFKKLQLEPLTSDETDDFVGEARPSYRIPYFDLDGRRTAYSRVRFLTDKRRRAFTRKAGKAKDGTHRYSQPFNSSPHVYLPPYFNWRKIAKSPDQKLLITEGEKKAAAACKAGIPCIALGGVYGFKSQKRMYDLIPELQEFTWEGRDVEVCYDADVMMKTEVRQALSMLAMTLTQTYKLGSLNFVMLDAETAGSKTGLDDYLKEHGSEGFDSLRREEYRAGAKLAALNELVCYVQAKLMFFDIQGGKYFKSLNHVRESYMNMGEEMAGNGNGTVLLVDLWAKSTSRRTVLDVKYLPGKDNTEKETGILNLWRPTDVKPKKGTPKLWLELVHYIMRKPEYTDWFLKWLAYPVQHPGAKMFQAPFVYGKKQGIGKTFAVDPVMQFIYGESNFHRLANTDISSRFNEYAGTKIMVVTNEIYLPDYSDRRAAMGSLKDVITRETVNTEEKFQPKVTYTDHCNYYFSSNHADALVLEPDDRRFFVIEAPDDKLSQSTYTDLDKYVRGETGKSNILHYLQNLDTSDVDPKADAMFTKWKSEIVGLSRDALSEFNERLLNDAETLMMVNGNLPDLELFRAEDVLRVFEMTYPKYRFNVTVSRMGRMLDDPRIEKRRVRASQDQPAFMLYAMFNREKWNDRNNKKWAEHYMDNAKRYGNRSRH